MEKRTWYRPAANGTGKIYSVLYREEGIPPKGLLCIVHGMQSHSGRYIWLAEHLANKGYVVAMLDLQGHGRSANVPGSFGEENGWEYLLHDLRRLVLQVKRWFPELPLFMLGHSMGSFLTRSYAARFPEDLDGMLLSGTAGSSWMYAPCRAFMAAECRRCGALSDAGKYGQRLSEYFNRNIPNPVNAGAWCCSVEAVCLEHAEDPLAVEFTIGAYRDMLSGLISVSDICWAGEVPDIPIYIFAGGADPVGEYGKGPAEVYAWLYGSGHRDLCFRIYPGKRHEILNEDIRWKVVEELEGWLSEKVKNGKKAAVY